MLYLVAGGGNDVRMASAQTNKILRDAMLNGAVQGYRDVVAKLVDAGARTIVAGRAQECFVGPTGLVRLDERSHRGCNP